jgi:hypothetical protein
MSSMVTQWSMVRQQVSQPQRPLWLLGGPRRLAVVVINKEPN